MTYLRRLLTGAAITAASIALLVLAGTGTVQAQGTGNGISDPASPHNFADTGDLTWNFRGEICRVCHVPHDHGRAGQLYLNGLLWNHQVSAATYTMYDHAWSNTLNNGQSPQPDGIAKLCLGCHDGTVSINQFDKNYDGSTNGFGDTMNDINPGFQVSTFTDGSNIDLRGTHPLSIVYDDVDAKLNPVSTTMGDSGTIQDVLDNGKVQCSSCHDVHDQESVAGTHLLRVGQTVALGGTASGLCLTCHDK